ncbi:choice-of-anchor J domain-containing protein, partial [candidate division CSSED10-310 bacterium]
YSNSTTFSEEFLMQSKAIAVFSPTRVSYSWYNDDLVKGYYDAIWDGMLPYSGGSPYNDDLYRLGDALGWGKAYVLSQYPVADIVTLTTTEIHHLFGDPTMEMWTDVPGILTVSPGSSSIGATTLNVNVDTTGAAITVVQNGQIIGQVTNSVSGSNAVALSPAAAQGVLYVTVTKHNYIPYRGTVDVGNVYSISGYVYNGASGVSGVWITFDDSVPPARTDGSGYYNRKVSDGTYRVSAENEKYTVLLDSQEAIVSGANVTNLNFDVEPYRVQVPYIEDFETGRLGPAWTEQSDLNSRASILDCPHGGNYGLIFDTVYPLGVNSAGAAILSVDLACRSDAELSFWWRDAGDEDHAQDGVFIRRNSSDSWCQIFTFSGDQTSYTQETIDLNSAADTCWSSTALTSEFQIKFQQYDNFWWFFGTINSDGIALDDVSITASGGTYTWDGIESSAWNDPDNWDTGCVPGPLDDVTIPVVATHWPDITAEAYAHDLTINNGARLNATENASLNIYGNYEEIDSGYFNGTKGTIIFKGSTPQTIKMMGFPDTHFNHLQIGDGATTSSVTANSDIDVNGNLILEKGATFAASDNFIYVGGNWIDNLGTFNRGTSSVIFDGTGQNAQREVVRTPVILLGPEAFEAVTFPPSGWTRIDNTGNGTWDRNDYVAATNHTGGSGFCASSRDDKKNNIVTYDTELRSPSFSISESGASLSYESNFQAYHTSNEFADLDISTNGGSNWINLSHWTSDHGPTSEIVSLLAYAGDTVILRWRYICSADWTYYWQIDDVLVTEPGDSVGELEFYNLRVTGTGNVVTFDGDVTVQNDLVVDSGAILDVGSYEITSVGSSVTNNGGLRQTQNIANGETKYFMNIASGKYYGVEINPTSGDMGSTTVTVFGNRSCFDYDTAVLRCFEIQPATGQTADITFYYRTASEANSQNTPDGDLKVWHYIGGGWTQQTYCGHGTTGSFTWIEATCSAPYSPFSLADDNPNPTGVTLVSFQGRQNKRCVVLRWETATELDTAGFNVYRARKLNGIKTKINDTLIPAQGFAGLGSIYKNRDCRLRPGIYFYWLEEVSNYGSTTLYDPIEVKFGKVIQPGNVQLLPSSTP